MLLYILLLKTALFACGCVLSRTLFCNLWVMWPAVDEALTIPEHEIELYFSYLVEV